MPGAAAPPGADDPAGAAGSGGSTAGRGGEVAGGVCDVGLGTLFSAPVTAPLLDDGAVFCCAPGGGVSDPAAEATGTGTSVSPVPDPGDTDGEEL
jgi:hypothetical protein